jgi:hypothetical protein
MDCSLAHFALEDFLVFQKQSMINPILSILNSFVIPGVAIIFEIIHTLILVTSLGANGVMTCTKILFDIPPRMTLMRIALFVSFWYAGKVLVVLIYCRDIWSDSINNISRVSPSSSYKLPLTFP